MDAFSEEALRRLPLAEGVMKLFRFALDENGLDAIFEKYRGRSYEKALSFDTIVRLVADALLEHSGSANQAIKRSKDDLSASKEAVYGKLRRLPISLSKGFLLVGTQRLREVMPVDNSPLPKSLRRLEVLFVDGKKIKHVPKLLKAARQVKGEVLGGKTLASLSWKTRLVVAMEADPDGEVSDQRLVPGLLDQVREVTKGPRLFILDRQFCDLVQPAKILAGGDHFLIRYSHKVSYTRDTSRPIRRGMDERGNRFQEEWGWIGQPDDPRREYVRRIDLDRQPRPDGKALEPVILITNLIDADKYPAVDLLNGYLNRWGIETVFQRITEVFHLQELVSTTPEGTIFQYSFCMLIYNMIQVVTRYISDDSGIPEEEISQELLFYDVHRQLIAWGEFIGPALTVEETQPISDPAEMRACLTTLLSGRWTELWRKSPKKKSAPQVQRTVRIPGGHTSMYRLIRDATPKRGGRKKKE